MPNDDLIQRIDKVLSIADLMPQNTKDNFWNETYALLKNCKTALEANNTNKWQSIENAPKGEYLGELSDLGPEIDLYSGSRRYANCCWSHTQKAWVMVVRYVTPRGQRKTSYNIIKDPTHFQYLPQPPEAK